MLGIDLFRWLKRKTKSDHIPINGIDLDDELGELVSSVQIREMAFWSAVNLVANCVSKCEYKTFEKGKEVRGREYYLWNVEPNRNQNSSVFLHKLIAQLYKNNECLVIPNDGKELLVADSYQRKAYVLYDDVFTDVAVGDFTFRQSFVQQDVLFFQLGSQDMRQVVNGIYLGYVDLIKYGMSAYQKSRGTKGVFNYGALPLPDTEEYKMFQEVISNKLKPWLAANNGALPLGEGQAWESIQKYSSGTNETTREVAKAETAYFKQNQELKKTETQLNNATAQVKGFERELSENNDTLDEAGKTAKESGEKAVKGESGWSKLAGGLGTVASAAAKTVAALGAVVAAGVAAAGKWVGDSIGVFATFEDSMKQVQATMGLTGEEGAAAFSELADAAKEAGASTRFTASEAAEALNYLALAGYDVDKAIGAMPTVLNLAAAGGIDLAYASDLVTDSMSALGMSTDELDGFVDQLAKTSQKSNTNVAQLGEAILTVGGTAKVLAGGTVELNTALGILADNGVKGSEGGTALRNIILSLTAPTDKAAKSMEALGVQVADAEGQMRPLDEIMQDLNESLSTMSDLEKTQTLNEIFNKNDLKSVNALLGTTTERFGELSAAIEESGGAAEQMAETMESGLAGSKRSLSSAYEGLQIAIGEQFAGMAQSVVDETTGMIRDITAVLSDGFQQGDMKKIGDRISGFLIQGVRKITEYLPEMVEIITGLLTELVDVIVVLLPTLLPSLLDGAMQLFQGLMDSIMTNLGPLMSMATDMMTQFSLFLIEALPQLIDAAIQIVVALAMGIAEALPELIPAAVDAVMTIVETLIDNIDLLIDAAIAIIVALAEGLMNALPRLIDKIPIIIQKLIDAIITNLPKILGAGVNILLEVAKGLIKAIPQLVSKIPEIISAIVDGFTSWFHRIVDIGKNIVDGIWQGILSMANWIKDKVTGFFGGIVDGVKDFLGIHSPSRLFAGIGENMALGLGEGFTDEMNKVSREIDRSIPTDFAMKGTYHANAQMGEGIVNGLAPLLSAQQGGTYIIRVEMNNRVIAEETFNPLQAVARQRGVSLG